MKDKIIKKLGKGGLVIVGLLYFVGLLCVATLSPAMALGGAALPLVFGMATAEGSDAMSNLRTCPYTHNAALEPGDPIVYNGAVLVAVNTTGANVENVFIYQGKMTFPKEAALAINPMDKVYWDAGNSVVTTTSAGNTECGFCVETAAAADSTVVIMLLPGVAILDLVQSTQNTIADPGDAGAVPVTKSGVCPITTGAAGETRTLAIPGHIGQIMAICMDVDGGGDCVITVAAAINQAGNTHITLDDAGDNVVLIGVQKAGGLVWRVLVNDGCTLAA